MSAMLDQLLTADQRTHAVLADVRAAAALDRDFTARAMKARIGPLEPQHTMNELERARAGIDHTGKPVRPNFAAVLADCRWEDQMEAERQQLLDEAHEDTGSGAFEDARDAEREHGAYY